MEEQVTGAQSGASLLVVSILVVEDNAAIRKTICLALRGEGYGVTEAIDGEAAMRSIESNAPALVLLDCRLPDMDGFEAARRLRVLAPGIPVIAMLGWAQADEGRMHAHGFLDVLVKPVDVGTVLETVDRHVGINAGAEHAGKTVLLVEHDPTQRTLASLALTLAGFDVTIAEDAASAFDVAVSRKPAAILSDVLMPRLDGFALCKAIRSDSRVANVPVVLMAARDVEDDDRQLAIRLGAADYVSRTQGFSAATHALRKALEDAGHPALAEPVIDLEDRQLRRISRQLERQACIGIGLARRAAAQTSALAILDELSDTLARQLDPESDLGESLGKGLEAAGLSVGAILLRATDGNLLLNVSQGVSAELDWSRHAEFLQRAIAGRGMVSPSSDAGEAGSELLAALGVASALVVPIAARDETFGALLLASKDVDLAVTGDTTAARTARAVSLQLGQAIALSHCFTKLGRAEQRNRALFENARDAIGLLTPAGVIVEVNRRWEEHLGIPRAQLVGHSVADFAPPSSQSEALNEFAHAVAEGGGAIRLVPIRSADGAILQMEMSRTVIDVGGERFVLAIARDVSARIRLEEQLRQAQKMEAIGRLAGGIAHDFNNALAVILSYTELLLDDLDHDNPMWADINEIRNAGTRAADLTKQLLTFSRKEVVQPKTLDLNVILESTDKMLRRILGADIQLHSSPASNLGSVRADPGNIEQVIMNLAVNARDAMPTGGVLTMATSNIDLDDDYAREHIGAKAGPHVVLTVTDNGCGMDRATQTRIFEPFFTTKAAGQGTGLGLSTVFGIVSQCGGSVWVSSELGKGTTFEIYLPRVNAPSDAPRKEVPTSRIQGSETILLVEDDDQVRRVARTILENSGYRVLAASNASEALGYAGNHDGTIHLLLADVVMPQMSGPELAKELIALRPNMRMLCMSGYTDDALLRHGVSESHIAFIQKPFTPSALSKKIREVLDTA